MNLVLSEAIRLNYPVEIVASRNQYAILANGAYYCKMHFKGKWCVVHYKTIEDAAAAITEAKQIDAKLKEANTKILKESKEG